MPSEVILPRVDMDMTTGKISKWLVAPGTAVTKGQPLFEIETDKATMEIEAEADGTIRDLVGASAEDIPVGSVVAWIFAENEAAASPPPAALVSRPAPAHEAKQEPDIASSPGAAPRPPACAEAGDRMRATPLARRLARMHGIELRHLQGSGPRGRIQAADIPATPQAPAAPSASPPSRAEVARDEATRPDAGLTFTRSATSRRGSGSPRPLREGTGTPLLLVHGFGSETNSWRPFLQSLPPGRPVFGLDLPGHGAAPLEGIGAFDDLVDAVASALVDLGSPIDVVAHSLGSAVMAAVAARGLADLRSLLMLAPAGLGPEINGSFVQGFLDATSEAALAPWMRELVADPQSMMPSLVRATLNARAGTDRAAAQRRLASALFPDGTQSFSIRADLARLRMPTRVVFGTSDRIIPARHATGLPPLVALHLLPDVGHMPYIEARETVASILAHTVRL